MSGSRIAATFAPRSDFRAGADVTTNASDALNYTTMLDQSAQSRTR